MAAHQSLRFPSNVLPSFSSSLQHQQNQYHKPNSLSFKHKKRPRQSPCLSISSSSFPFSITTTYFNPNPNCYPYSNPNPNCYPYSNPNPNYYSNSFSSNNTFTLAQPNNDYDDHNNNTTSFFSNTFFDHPSPQTLIPSNNDSLDFDEPIIGDDFSSAEDQTLLASFLAEPPIHIVDNFSAPAQCEITGGQTIVDSDCDHRLVKKPTVVSPQSIAARERRRKISEKTSELGKLIPGTNKMSSTAEMFQAAYKYVKFLKAQVSVLQCLASSNNHQETKELEVNCLEELSALASPIIQEKLYREEKCLVPKEFLDRSLSKNQARLYN